MYIAPPDWTVVSHLHVVTLKLLMHAHTLNRETHYTRRRNDMKIVSLFPGTSTAACRAAPMATAATVHQVWRPFRKFFSPPSYYYYAFDDNFCFFLKFNCHVISSFLKTVKVQKNNCKWFLFATALLIHSAFCNNISISPPPHQQLTLSHNIYSKVNDF